MFHGINVTIESAWQTPARRILSLIWLIVTCSAAPFAGINYQPLGWLAGLLSAGVFIFMLYIWTRADLQKLVEERRDDELKNGLDGQQ